MSTVKLEARMSSVPFLSGAEEKGGHFTGNEPRSGQTELDYNATGDD